MKQQTIFMFTVLIMLGGCSGEDPASTSRSETATKNDALMGYKNSLDTAKSISTMAEESEMRKNQTIQDLD